MKKQRSASEGKANSSVRSEEFKCEIALIPLFLLLFQNFDVILQPICK